MRILLIEDDAQTAEYIRRGLTELGQSVDHARDGQEGLLMATSGTYDVLVIDRMLPRLDGLTVLRMLREGHVRTPTLFLTAMGSIDDRVKGLESGGDDYLVKPFAFSEFYARVCSLGRRPPLQEVQTVFTLGGLEMDLIKRTVTRAGKAIELQPTEFRLLEYLLRHAGRAVTRTMLLEHVWGFHFDPKTNIVETHISRLRAKVDRGFTPELIHTLRGVGYKADVAP
ncbi:two-component system, OmpR family, response regulator [Stigmatella aurantiaca]|uniref:Two-component system, OmpR family, response regulator n=1 Tax=Stigmatella aurantiaca TaxID=41 RepID=A0A1H7RVB6_STIAU|nr:response regulator transcription factor [Stigmatella aurantiaca]SEL63949.1 two-component system, OmpR family, response regulator [Stigmatella aurantiaca]